MSPTRGSRQQEEPTPGRAVGQPAPAPASRRTVLKGAAVTAGLAAAGLTAAGPAHAGDGGRAESVTARMGGTSVTLSLLGGALRWSARRGGRTVLDDSALGLRLGDGTVLGDDVRVTGRRYRTRRTTWTPVYGRNATVT
ncbi:glycoside hydrolase family 97 N-terminal domain-containing protein, partial [Streptomyces sp. NPDC006386]